MTNVSIGESVNLYHIFYNVNETSQGWFVGLFLIILWIVLMSLASERIGYAKTGLISSFSVFIISGLFWSIGMLNISYSIIFVVLMIFSIILMFSE